MDTGTALAPTAFLSLSAQGLFLATPPAQSHISLPISLGPHTPRALQGPAPFSGPHAQQCPVVPTLSRASL